MVISIAYPVCFYTYFKNLVNNNSLPFLILFSVMNSSFFLFEYFTNTPQGGISSFTKFIPKKQEMNF